MAWSIWWTSESAATIVEPVAQIILHTSTDISLWLEWNWVSLDDMSVSAGNDISLWQLLCLSEMLSPDSTSINACDKGFNNIHSTTTNPKVRKMCLCLTVFIPSKIYLLLIQNDVVYIVWNLIMSNYKVCSTDRVKRFYPFWLLDSVHSTDITISRYSVIPRFIA